MRVQRVHIGAFLALDLCWPAAATAREDVEEWLPGSRWEEIKPYMSMLTCEHCKLILAVMEANGLMPLYNSDQRLMAQRVKELLK